MDDPLILTRSCAHSKPGLAA